MAFKISPGVYPVEPPDNYVFPDDMPYRETLIRMYKGSLEWEINYLTKNYAICYDPGKLAYCKEELIKTNRELKRFIKAYEKRQRKKYANRTTDTNQSSTKRKLHP
jgi:hypothetical protein